MLLAEHGTIEAAPVFALGRVGHDRARALKVLPVGDEQGDAELGHVYSAALFFLASRFFSPFLAIEMKLASSCVGVPGSFITRRF